MKTSLTAFCTSWAALQLGVEWKQAAGAPSATSLPGQLQPQALLRLCNRPINRWQPPMRQPQGPPHLCLCSLLHRCCPTPNCLSDVVDLESACMCTRTRLLAADAGIVAPVKLHFVCSRLWRNSNDPAGCITVAARLPSGKCSRPALQVLWPDTCYG